MESLKLLLVYGIMLAFSCYLVVAFSPYFIVMSVVILCGLITDCYL